MEALKGIFRGSLKDMVDYHVVEHYASHLEWLINLAHSIEKNDTENFPQTNETLCKFGKWLLSDAKSIIKNNSKLKELDKIHSQLHQVAFQIKKFLIHENELNYNILLSYLEKSELLSLSIGTELALIDNTIINQKAVKDTLTGALGRQVLNQLFQNQYEIALATSTKYTIALCDLDHFKNVNDTYGHVAGDKILQHFVQIVKKNLRNSDIIIRYGGEEFVIILPAVESKIAFNVLNKIRDEFESFVLEYEGKNVSTTVSMGLYELEPKDKYNPMILEESIKCADYKLYQAKNNGRNQIVK